MKVPLVDLKGQHAAIRGEIDEAVGRVLDSCQFILGDEVRLLEEEVAAYCGTAHGVGVASGTENYYSFDYGHVHFVVLDSEVAGLEPDAIRRILGANVLRVLRSTLP